MRQALDASRLATGDCGIQLGCLRETARMLSSLPPGITPPEAGEYMYRMIRERAGVKDPYLQQKQEQNQLVSDLLPWLRKTVEDADDPLLVAARLAMAGNAIDPGAQHDFQLEKSVQKALCLEQEMSEYPLFRERLKAAGSILYIADNCGEVVFDRVLIETMYALGCAPVTLAVRAGPIINDVTMTEALQLGLDRLCRVISSGMHMPGTLPGRAEPGFREAFEKMDIVISKGQGNWETLEDCGREVFFLLQAKCEAVALINQVEVGTLLLKRSTPLCGS